MNQRDLLVRIDSEFSDKGFKSAEASAKSMVRELERQEKATRDLANLQIAAQREQEQRHAQQMASMTSLGRGFTAVGVLAAAGLGLAAKSASDWESAWAGVRKTVDGSDAEIAALEGEFRNLAKTLPATAEEIAAVGEEAGALGVARGNLVAFTKTAIDLGETTNLSATEAASGLAKLGNIMGVLPADADRAGAALVALGNNGASTEDEILGMSLRIAGAGRVIGLTEAQVLGFASALSSVGIEAEAGGSSISRVMIDLSSAVERGGDSLDTFAAVAGVTADQFAAKFRTNAAGAVTDFIAGLGRMRASGQDVTQVLDDLGLSEIRVRDTLLRTSGAADMLRSSIDLGTRSWEENIALIDEANKRYATSEARIQMARNQLNDAAIDIGGTVLPAIAGAAERVGFLAEAFTGLPDPVKSSVVQLGGAVTALSTIGGLALMAVPKLEAMNETLRNTGPRGAAAAKGLGAVGSALMGPWGLALAGATVGLGLWAEAQYKADRRVSELTSTLDEQTGAVTENSRQWAVSTLLESGALDKARGLGLNLDLVTDAALGNTEAMRTLDAQMQTVLDTQALFANDPESRAAFEQTNRDVSSLRDTLGSANGDLGKARDAWKLTSEAMGETGDAAEGAAADNDQLNTAIVQTAEEAKRARDELDALIESVENYGETLLEARDASRNYEGAIDDALESLKEHGKTLDINTEAGRANQAALDEVATSALASATANFENGESVDAVTKRVMTARGEFVTMATKMGMSKAEAEKLATQLGLTKDNVSRLGTEVNELPKAKNIKITAATQAARESVMAFKRFVDGLSATVQIRYTYGGRLPSGGRSLIGGQTFSGAYGGYTGEGGESEVAGIVHRREFVSDAGVTQQWRGLLEHMQSGGDPRSYFGMTAQPVPVMTSSVVGPTSYAETYDQRLFAENLNLYGVDNPNQIVRKARLAPYEANRRAS